MAMNAVMSGHTQIPAYGGAANADDNAQPSTNNDNDNPIAGDPGERSSSTPPLEYIPQQQHHHPQSKQPPTPTQQQQQLQTLSSPSIGSANAPFGLGNNSAPMRDPLFHNPLAASFPWSIGSTDGSFALVNLQQHQQQMHMQHQQQELQLRQAMASVTVGDDAAAAHQQTQQQKKPSPSGPDNSGNGDGNDHTTDPKTGAAAAASTSAKVAGATNAIEAAIAQSASIIRSGRSLYHDKLFHQSSSSVEGVLAATCDVMGFDIAEMWLRTGLKTHQLTNSHLRPTALQDSVRQDLVEVYYGEKSNERTHRLSPALCKKAKDANDIVWVTAHTQNGAEALRMSISNVRTAVAVPVCHEASNTNVTIIYFSIRRIVLQPAAVEFLIHMSLSAAVTSVNALSTDGLIDRVNNNALTKSGRPIRSLSSSAHGELSKTTDGRRSKSDVHANRPPSSVISYRRPDKTSVTGARLDLQWRQLLNVEYLTDGGNSWIHTAVFDGKPVVVKTLRPECQDTAVAINEIESEVGMYSSYILIVCILYMVCAILFDWIGLVWIGFQYSLLRFSMLHWSGVRVDFFLLQVFFLTLFFFFLRNLCSRSFAIEPSQHCYAGGCWMDQQEGSFHRPRAVGRGNPHANARIRHPHPRQAASVLEEETASLPRCSPVCPVAGLCHAILQRTGGSGKHGLAP
jgi:hypothetical protein